jgi:hypothetical protein
MRGQLRFRETVAGRVAKVCSACQLVWDMEAFETQYLQGVEGTAQPSIGRWRRLQAEASGRK